MVRKRQRSKVTKKRIRTFIDLIRRWFQMSIATALLLLLNKLSKFISGTKNGSVKSRSIWNLNLTDSLANVHTYFDNVVLYAWKRTQHLVLIKLRIQAGFEFQPKQSYLPFVWRCTRLQKAKTTMSVSDQLGSCIKIVVWK